MLVAAATVYVHTSFGVCGGREVAGESGQSGGGPGWLGSSLTAVGGQEGEAERCQHHTLIRHFSIIQVMRHLALAQVECVRVKLHR